MRIEALMPEYDAIERHEISIAAPVAVVYNAVIELDLRTLPLAQILLAIRGLPSLLFKTESRRLVHEPMTLDALQRYGFVKLLDEPNREILLGVTGKFWRPIDNITPTTASDYDGEVPAGLARALWNYTLSEDDGTTRLATETRIRCGDAASRTKFLAYWTLVRPFSGLIRILILRKMRSNCTG